MEIFLSLQTFKMEQKNSVCVLTLPKNLGLLQTQHNNHYGMPAIALQWPNEGISYDFTFVVLVVMINDFSKLSRMPIFHFFFGLSCVKSQEAKLAKVHIIYP